MNISNNNDAVFDQIADRLLRTLERALGNFDPDEIDAELAGDVLTITVLNQQKMIINRHRAARQIWMAANRQAWHFDKVPDSDVWTVEKTGEELFGTIGRVLSTMLQRDVQIVV